MISFLGLVCLSKGQIITTLAGNGIGGYSGDNGPAVNAELRNPTQITIDKQGNLLVADLNNHVIRKIDQGGIISTIAGDGTAGFSGDSGLATLARLNLPYATAIDSTGSIYIADWGNNRIRKIDSAGVISTIAGGSLGAYTGDGGPAIQALIHGPSAIAISSTGELYFADESNNVIRKINSAGIISTIAGNGTYGYSGDGGQASISGLKAPSDLCFDAKGNLYISDYGNFRIRKIDAAGIITTIAGGGNCGSSFCGDGGPATAAELWQSGMKFDLVGSLFIADQKNYKIRMVDTANVINTFAGTGIAGFSGDGGPAMSAEFNKPTKLALNDNGDLFIADFNNNRIRKISTVNHVYQNSCSAINIFPNPASTYVTISSKEICFQICFRNMLGQICKSINASCENCYLDIQDLPKGVYTVQVSTLTEKLNSKIIKH